MPAIYQSFDKPKNHMISKTYFISAIVEFKLGQLICNRNSVKFGVDLRHIINSAGV
jgi:hypothetical protein